LHISPRRGGGQAGGFVFLEGEKPRIAVEVYRRKTRQRIQKPFQGRGRNTRIGGQLWEDPPKDYSLPGNPQYYSFVSKGGNRNKGKRKRELKKAEKGKDYLVQKLREKRESTGPETG